MKKRKNWHRVAAVLCALVVVFGSVGSVPYEAAEASVREDTLRALMNEHSWSKRNEFVFYEDFSYIAGINSSGYFFCMGFKGNIMFTVDSGGALRVINMSKMENRDSVEPYYISNVLNYNTEYSQYVYVAGSSAPRSILYSDMDVFCFSIDGYDGDGYKYTLGECVYEADFDVSGEVYSPALGYLQKVKENRVYDKVPLGEVVNDKFTARWYFDQFTTTGVDLSSGDYFINYYQERWLVKGYGDDDVIEKSDRYLLASYIIPDGFYIETYSEDIDSVLAGQGYEPPTTLELLWNKFVTTHHYFQVTDAANNQVGGYLHVYYTDDTGAFGVEYIGETLNDKGEFDEDGYREEIGEDSITSDDTDAGFEELENGTGADFGDIDGVNDFSGVLINYAEGVAGFGNALGAFLSVLPPWVLVSVGLAACLLVAGIAIKILAG